MMRPSTVDRHSLLHLKTFLLVGSRTKSRRTKVLFAAVSDACFLCICLNCKASFVGNESPSRPVGSIFRLGGLFSGHENLGRVVICNDHNMQCLQQLGVQGAEPPEAHEISLSLRS